MTPEYFAKIEARDEARSRNSNGYIIFSHELHEADKDRAELIDYAKELQGQLEAAAAENDKQLLEALNQESDIHDWIQRAYGAESTIQAVSDELQNWRNDFSPVPLPVHLDELVESLEDIINGDK